MQTQDQINENEDTERARRSKMRAVLKSMDHFIALSRTMPVTEAQVFLYVSLNEGKSLVDLVKLTGLKQATLSRYLLDLSDKARGGGPGFGLVKRESDPTELRKNMYSLSAQGRNMLSSIIEDIDRV
jgi:DNA-binding MarR family transcriptional regulator